MISIHLHLVSNPALDIAQGCFFLYSLVKENIFIGVNKMTTILIVDDDKNILNLVSIHLSEQGYHVLKAQDGIEALEILHEEICHLAVVDVMMPFMDGYELTKEIRRQYNIPVILLTAKSQIDDKEQ